MTPRLPWFLGGICRMLQLESYFRQDLEKFTCLLAPCTAIVLPEHQLWRFFFFCFLCFLLCLAPSSVVHWQGWQLLGRIDRDTHSCTARAIDSAVEPVSLTLSKVTFGRSSSSLSLLICLGDRPLWSACAVKTRHRCRIQSAFLVLFCFFLLNPVEITNRFSGSQTLWIWSIVQSDAENSWHEPESRTSSAGTHTAQGILLNWQRIIFTLIIKQEGPEVTHMEKKKTIFLLQKITLIIKLVRPLVESVSEWRKERTCQILNLGSAKRDSK